MEPSEDVLRGLLAAAPDALLAVDPEGRIVFVNDQAEQVFGWTRADLLGRPVEDLVPERFGGHHPSLRAGYMQRPTTRTMGAGLELWARRQDGSEFPAEISLSSLDTIEGTLVAAAIRDVSVARRTEQRFRAVLASAPDAIVGVSSSGIIELVNEQVERLFGWTAEELVGAPIETLVPESALARHVAHRNGYMRDPEARPMGQGLQLSARRKDGTTFPAEISLSAVADTEGDDLVLAAVRDVSERIELEAVRREQALADQREQSHRLESLGQLAGGVAHDFNNLLGVILNYTTLVARGVSDPRTIADLEEIRTAADRGAALTRQLLTFARRDVMRLEAVEVNEVVLALAGMLDRTLGEHIRLQLDLPDEPLVALADRHQLEQIVLNLAINARDAMVAGGVLTILVEATSGPGGASAAAGVLLSVSDTGEGMPPEVVERAFEPFFTTKPTGAGTGLGLATVYGIVQQSGGSVTIRSTVGEGTRVAIVLPAAERVERRAEGRSELAAGGTERILVVEDERALRVATARILMDRGYSVLTASDGIEALELFEVENGRIDLLLSDVAMPRMRGDELAHRLLELVPGLPVVFLSGYDSGDPPSTGRLIPKPVAEDDLLSAIREALDG